MKTLFYMGRNDQNVSRLSWKIWKIERKGKRVTTWWGAAEVGPRRKPVPKHDLQTKSWTFRTEEAAREDERRRLQEKENEGYERDPRRSRARATW
jgi:hypothetical protein